MKQEEIKELIRVFSESGLTDFCYQTETESLTLKHKEKVVRVQSAASFEAEAAKPEVKPAALPKIEGVPVTAPLAGVFYRAAKPGEEPYVREGSAVKKGDTLGLMEAMKLMSEIPSPVDGVVKSIEVENGEFAEFGKVLMVIEEKHV